MSLGWTPVLAALAVIVLNEWERSNAGSHALMSHAAALLAPWTCCLSGGGTLSQADVPGEARGATRALVDWPHVGFALLQQEAQF